MVLNWQASISFLIANGLQSCHNFLDIGCGSLRLGQFIITLLAEGNYYGLEPEKILVECGLEYEISPQVIALKRPNFAHNCNFHFDSLCSFDFAMANSIFTHMNKSDIESCFAEVYKKPSPVQSFSLHSSRVRQAQTHNLILTQIQVGDIRSRNYVRYRHNGSWNILETGSIPEIKR